MTASQSGQKIRKDRPCPGGGVIGAAIALAALREQLSPEFIVLAIGSAIGLTLIDTIYALRGTISKIYLVDAVAEMALILAWIVFLLIR
jgi:hypothetical protein